MLFRVELWVRAGEEQEQVPYIVLSMSCATLSIGYTTAEPRGASLGQSATLETGLAVALSLCPLMCRLPRSSSPKMGNG